MNKQWFSAMLQFVILVEGEGATRLSRSVVLFLADDWPEAKRRAIELGRGMETSYIGGTGKEVRWRLESLETLDLLGEEITDGREVYSEPADVPRDRAISFDETFDPEQSSPTQSGV